MHHLMPHAGWRVRRLPSYRKTFLNDQTLLHWRVPACMGWWNAPYDMEKYPRHRHRGYQRQNSRTCLTMMSRSMFAITFTS